ncbi:MAG: lipopolysaccharide biosynthesis protein [Chitinivibrionia bacterium]|nr:lipopolysaccharide biosynthesis protein [Chitinivibrionia bacterium]
MKNTLALYFRQIITMFVALFTSRIVLQTLGVTDFGINNVVAGVVATFGFMSGTLMNITQRFISVELGKSGELSVLKKIFSTSMILHIGAAVIVLILAQTAGVWFLNNMLVIPEERMLAANWVYQFAVLSFVMSLLNAPLMALIVSHEDMHIYGYMGIFDVAARLLTVYLLVIINADKLILFALFGFAVTCSVWLFYFIYCRKNYQEARFSFVYDKSLIKDLGKFGGYVFGGNISAILVIEGVNIMMNIFFGPAINAARGLANSISVALLSFGNNFRQTLTPQITMSYAANNTEATWTLVERGTRMYYFLLFVFSLPVLAETEFILKLWLGNVPEHTAIFTKLMIIHVLVLSISSTCWSVVHASGKVKLIYCLSYIFNGLILMLSYLACVIGYPPHYVLGVNLAVILILYQPVFLFASKKLYGFPIKSFAKRALVPILRVSVVAFLPFYFTDKLFAESTLRSFITIAASMLWTVILVVFIGLTKNERVKIFAFLKRKFLILF